PRSRRRIRKSTTRRCASTKIGSHTSCGRGKEDDVIEPRVVKDKMAQVLKIPVARFEDQVALLDLVPDSFALVEMVIGLQEELGVDLVHNDLQSVRTVGDLVRTFQERARKA